MKLKLKRLRLRKGDILLAKKGPNSFSQIEDLMWAAKQAGIEVNVPIILVDKLNDYKIRHDSPIVTAEMLQMSMEGPDAETTDWERTATNLMERLAR